MQEKIKHARRIIKHAVDRYEKIVVACSFGKDSMAVVHLAREVDPKIPVFSVLTPYKPKETFAYLAEMDRLFHLETTVYMVARQIDPVLQKNNIEVKLLSTEKFERESSRMKERSGCALYERDPDRCCELLKVEPTREAVKNVEAWICGLRNTEGKTRKNYQEIEFRGLIKINPILNWTEDETYQYLKANNIPLHPWYTKVSPDGKRIRSLGCEPCTVPVHDYQEEREGRWQGTNKWGGECGIHTRQLK